MHRSPVVWDPLYKELWRRLVLQVAGRYRDTPLLGVAIHGHNDVFEMYLSRKDEEVKRLKELGWSLDLAEKEWKEWIDFFAKNFPSTRLILVMSPISLASSGEVGQGTEKFVRRLVEYMDQRHPGRLVLMSHALNGRTEQNRYWAMELCVERADLPNIQETVGSFADHPERQGSVEMTALNMRRLNPSFYRAVAGDVPEGATMGRLLAEYERARKMTLDDYRKDLQKRGLFTTNDTWRVAKEQKQP